MWDLPGPRLEPVCPALAGGFSTTVPPGKSPRRRLLRREQLLFPSLSPAWLLHPLLPPRADSASFRSSSSRTSARTWWPGRLHAPRPCSAEPSSAVSFPLVCHQLTRPGRWLVTLWIGCLQSSPHLWSHLLSQVRSPDENHRCSDSRAPGSRRRFSSKGPRRGQR